MRAAEAPAMIRALFFIDFSMPEYRLECKEEQKREAG
jgi:hypothetical protein